MNFPEKLDLPPEFRIPYGRQFLGYVIDVTERISGKLPPTLQSWSLHRLTSPAKPLDPKTAEELARTVSPQDCLKSLAEIEALLQAEGPLMPWEVERRLAERQQQDIPVHLLDRAERFAALDHQPEPMTGWNQKAFGGLITAQSALFKKTTGTPVAVFDGDLSNMRGTNEFYYWLLCAQSGHSWEGVGGARDAALMTQAQALTDRATRILTRIAIQKTGGEGIRNGGDELRLIAFGFPEDRNKADAMVRDIHEASEIATARMGLHAHPHAKPEYARDPDRNGFGNAMGWFWLPTDDINFAEGATQAEAETDNAKKDLGRERQSGKYARYGCDSYVALSGAFFSVPETEAEKSDLARRAGAYLDASLAAMGDLEQELGIGPPAAPEDKPHPNLHRLGQLAGAHPFDRLPQDTELRDLVAEAFRNGLEDQDRAAFEALREKDKRLVEMVAAHAPMRDYITGAYAGQDLPALADIVFRVNETLRARALTEMPKDHPDRARLEASTGFFTISTSINIGGLNKYLGHEPTNVVLEHFNQNILRKSLATAGLSPDNACIVSLGGGDFTLLLQNVVQQPDGRWRMVKESDVQNILKEIETATQALNNAPSQTFLREEFNSASQPLEFRLIRDIPDVRQENQHGLRLFTTSRLLSIPPGRHDPGGLIAGQIRNHFEQEKQKSPAPKIDAAPVPAAPSV